MLGQKSENNPLPPEASSEDKDTWLYENSIGSVDIDIENLPTPCQDHTTDPCFPYPDGPGHQDVSPQQLATIWKLMQSVGMISFRPHFGESANSYENRWLLNTSEKIFVRVVECSEYPGFSLDSENRAYINKYFATHLQSLKQRYIQTSFLNITSISFHSHGEITSIFFSNLFRYRTEQWEEKHQNASRDMNRLNTRLGRVSLN